MKFKRKIASRIENGLFKGHVIMVYGPRRVGKTTLVKQIQDNYTGTSLYLNCDEPDIRSSLSNKSSTQLASLIGSNTLVVIDEAQRVKNIGITLKLLVDQLPNIQIIATGSSSFELSNRIHEPLTGRHRDVYLHALSTEELLREHSAVEEHRLMERRLLYGNFPQIVIDPSSAEETLRYIARDYLYKDVLEYQGIRNSDVLEKLLQALALQIGNQVSYTELASLLGIDKKTVEHYIRILEQAFVIFRLPSYSRNLRTELSKTRKIYFWDCGIRNAVLHSFQPTHLRSDLGQLWENYVVSERVKYLQNHNIQTASYFWRTYSQQEIDLVEEVDGALHGYEIKWKKQKKKAPKSWIDAYPDATWSVISPDSYIPFVS